MERILIIGGNGCGKTTFSEKLAPKLGLPLVHLDALYWRGGWQPAPRAEFDALLLRELEQQRFILDGNMSRTLPLRLQYCDTVIWMDFPRLACVCGAAWRSIKNHGKSRPDLGGFCPEKLDLRFLRSVWNFNKNNRPRFSALLADARGVEVIVLKNRRQARAFLRTL